ncbi:EamA family transporter [Leminorella grimontii]|uniref:EamA family transporter n=1 Tax=Leminorella grimontii TaxID=82981 RepID=UPI0020806015|nr:EamA family transporter [Leminorella grimontii]GKX59658.1 membrane protein [Leminorella grimontii]
MTTLLFLAVLAAALFHAGWNAIVKFGEDRFLGVALVAVFSGLVSVVCLPFFGMPSVASLPWLALSMLFHTGYCLFLSRAYASGDLGQVYPIARGSAPVLAALLSWLILSEVPPLMGTIGALLLVSGVLMMALAGRKSAIRMSGQTLVYALITAMFTASYTLSDGAGSRASLNPVAYTLWLFAINGVVMTFILFVRYRSAGWPKIRRHWRPGLLGGTMSLLSYGIVIWAMSQAPIALVAALRETSVLFAMVISVWWLKEPLSRMRMLAGLTIVAGVVLTRLG